MIQRKCQCCGVVITVKERSIARYCTKCAAKIASQKRLKAEKEKQAGYRFPDRPLTQDTEMLICFYTIEGMSVYQIADLLRRNTEQVTRILDDAKDKNRFAYYAKIKRD